MISFDPALPISARVDDIATAIADHPVVVIAGETGSGKTTQLPKICLQLGRRRIAHTQPRRIAARSVAERIAEEMKVSLGDVVGYQVRFTTKVSKATQLKVMTDGVLLNEIGFDRDLRRYDTIIIDEAHERSLNIDFLLGYLKQLVARRPELRVVITSATIDTARFSAHFDDAPIIEVSGRTYPVEIRYRPLSVLENSEIGEDDRGTRPDPVVAAERDQIDGIGDAVTELLTEPGGGDILVFLSGEREIRDTAVALTALELPHTEILPLYARLSAAEQHRVFAAHRGRRVVLSTNVAETSLTVPGIRYVVDVGTARVSRYSARTKVQRLPIEPISQASANQRSGRCGRTAPGVAIRLYSEEDFLSRPEFTEPEILRTNLASVILQMAQAKLGDIAAFGFVEAPDTAHIRDGLRLLNELGAIKRETGQVELTALGRQLARLPLDPRMGRMLIEAERRSCLREVMVIVAGLSIQDPRERPSEHAEQADQCHRRFWAPLDPSSDGGATSDSSQQGSVHPREPARQQRDGRKKELEPTPDASDFLAWLRLWDYLDERQKNLSGNAFRRMCRDEYLHYLRIREWQDLHTQLRQITRELGMTRNVHPADPATVHTAVMSGLLSHIGLAEIRDDTASRPARGKERRRAMVEYLGARGARFAIQPGSSVAKNPPALVMAAELVETSRLWARTVAAIDAGWVEEVGGHLLKRNYAEPHWSTRRQAVLAYETVSLFGVPLIARRLVNFGAIDPVQARQMFIRCALVEGQWRTRHKFWDHNQAVREAAQEREERTRQRGLVVDDEVIFSFYDSKIPTHVVSGAHFDSWWKKASRQQPQLLNLDLNDLLHHNEDDDHELNFPQQWLTTGASEQIHLDLDYVYEPGAGRDGVTAVIPMAVLNQVSPASFTWQVPGLREELATELIRTLPKQLRTQVVPAPDHARRALAWLAEHQIGPEDQPFPHALSTALRAIAGVDLVRDGQPAFAPATLPSHLQMSFRVIEATKPGQLRVLAEGKDLAELATELRPVLTKALTSAVRTVAHTGASEWEFGELADTVAAASASGHTAVGYPALTDEGATVGVVVYDEADRADYAATRGLRRLVQLNTPDPTKWVTAHLSNHDKFALASSPYQSVAAVMSDARLAAVGSLLDVPPRTITNQDMFRALCDRVRAEQADRMRAVVSLAAECLRRQAAAETAAAAVTDSDVLDDIAEQMKNLIFDGFLSATDFAQLSQVPRYVHAIEVRLATVRANPAKDQAGFEAMLAVEDAYGQLCASIPPGPLPTVVAEVGWMIEELRVSLFAQRLGTRGPVSVKRVMNAMAQARRLTSVSS